MKIAIVGGGAAGLFASLLLARAGHDVVVLEQDRMEPASDVEAAAASSYRPAAPQIVQPHIVMARCRELLLERLPDLYHRLIAAGVEEVPLSGHMPASLPDTTARPGDERLTTMMTRRSTVDWVLQRTVLATPGVTVGGGVRVVGLLTDDSRPRRVTGVRSDHGDLEADLVVDAAGRRSPIDRWLEDVGAPTADRRWAECGLAYFSRHYRVRPATGLPGPPTTRIVAGLDEFTVGIFGADHRTMQLVVAPLATDRRFGKLDDPEVFTAVLRTVPTLAAWLEVLDPVSPVFRMAGLHNTLRRLVVARAPVVTGLHAIGDSVCTTNPTLGRGLSLALLGAADLADVIDRHPEDRTEQALAMDRLVGDHVAPFYEDQADVDGARLRMLRQTIFGEPAAEPPPVDSDRVTYAELRAAAPFDPTAFRAFWQIMGMLCRPDEVYRDRRVVACTREALGRHGAGPTIAQPSRDQLLAALGRQPPGTPN